MGNERQTRFIIKCSYRDQEAFLASMGPGSMPLPALNPVSGPDGTLVLYETQARDMAERLNALLPHIEHVVVAAPAPHTPASRRREGT